MVQASITYRIKLSLYVKNKVWYYIYGVYLFRTLYLENFGEIRGTKLAIKGHSGPGSHGAGLYQGGAT